MEPPFTPIKCSDCDEGYSHPVGNCVICGCGPAPGAVNFHGEPMPQTPHEKKIVLWKLFNGYFPATLNGRDYPSAAELNN